MLGGFPRKLEDSLGPFNWATGVVHCDASGPTIHCKDVSPPNNHPHANGLLLLDGGKTLAVGDVFNGSTTIYDVDATSKQLTQRKRVVCLHLPTPARTHGKKESPLTRNQTDPRRRPG